MLMLSPEAVGVIACPMRLQRFPASQEVKNRDKIKNETKDFAIELYLRSITLKNSSEKFDFKSPKKVNKIF